MTTVVIGDNTGNDFSGTDDTHLKQTSATSNFGASSPLETTKFASGDWTHMVLKFTGLTNVTGPVTVSSATVSCYLVSAHAITNTVTCYRLLQNWVEAQATWNIYSTGNNWGTAGGTNATDRSSTTSASVATGTVNGVYKDYTAAQLASDVEAFINGTQSNYGWHFERTDGADDSDFKTWAASEGTDGQRPKLTVIYTASGGTTRGTPFGHRGTAFNGGRTFHGIMQ